MPGMGYVARRVVHPPVAALLPHRPPMLLLDEVCAVAQAGLTCRAVVRATSLFVREGQAHVVLALEYMAQTVAAFVGLRALARGEPIRVGYLVGSREVVFEVDHLAVGD